MRYVFTILILLLGKAATSQDSSQVFDGHKWEAPYHFPTPKEWGIERFLIPISFAPEISYKGVEDVRFAPRWAKKESEEYWSYAFLWFLEGKVNIDAKQIEKNLKAYYTGLVAINGAEIPKEKIIPVLTSFREVQKLGGDEQTFEGTVQMTDYMQQKTISLLVKVHRKECAGINNSYIFYELSPQPFSHRV